MARGTSSPLNPVGLNRAPIALDGGQCFVLGVAVVAVVALFGASGRPSSQCASSLAGGRAGGGHQNDYHTHSQSLLLQQQHLPSPSFSLESLGGGGGSDSAGEPFSLSAVSSEAGPFAIHPPTVGTAACEQEHSECRVMRARSGPPGGRGLGGLADPPSLNCLNVATRCRFSIFHMSERNNSQQLRFKRHFLACVGPFQNYD